VGLPWVHRQRLRAADMGSWEEHFLGVSFSFFFAFLVIVEKLVRDKSTDFQGDEHP